MTSGGQPPTITLKYTHTHTHTHTRMRAHIRGYTNCIVTVMSYGQTADSLTRPEEPIYRGAERNIGGAAPLTGAPVLERTVRSTSPPR